MPMGEWYCSRHTPPAPPEPAVIRVTVVGGVVQQVAGVPPGVRVEVWDYDTEGAREDECEVDAEGDAFTRAIYEGGEGDGR
jgi:hypothetical protein